MEIIAQSGSSIKIKAKNASFIINPAGKIDTETILLTKLGETFDSENLVIYGPGEFEVAGVSIKAEKIGDQIRYDFLEENQSISVLPTVGSVEKSEMEGFTGVVVIADEPVEKYLSGLTSDFVGIIGASENLPNDRENIKTIDKVNLKKIEEYKGFIVHLNK